MTKIVSKNFNIHNARQFIESVTEPASDNYYVTFGKHTSYSGSDSTVETPVDTFKYRTLTIYDDMIFGKKIDDSDINLVVDKKLWVANTVYDIYDDEEDLSSSDFYVATLDGSNYNVYKCLFNNDGEPSTVMPSTVDTSIFIESDGYAWKYLYTINSAQWSKFNSTSYMPVYSNSTVVAAATDRSIDVILTEYSGSYYNNYYDGTFENGTQIVSTTQFRLSGSASAFNDFYKGCIIEFTTGTGIEYKEITDYTVSGSTKTIILDSPVENTVEVGDTYRIYPKVIVYGDGQESNTCLAWAIVDDASSNSILKVEILRGGEGYRVCTANVVFDASVGVTDEATLRPIISPKGGHGYDPATELVANKVTISVEIDQDESGNIIAANDFRNVSLLKNPQFKNISLEYVGTTSIFDIGETVYQYRPIKLVGTVTANASSNVNILTGSSTLFDESLKVDDYILVQNTTSKFFSKVTAVTSNTQVTVSPGVSANVPASDIYLVSLEAAGEVVTYLSNSLSITAVTNNFSIDSKVIGSNSYASVTLTDVTNNSRSTNDLMTFQQTVKFDGTKSSSESFINDEYVYENGTYEDENLRPTGRLFHFIDDTTDSLFITNERNIFSSNATIVGNTSGAVFVATNKYDGDLIKDSGEVLYISNVEAVTKTDSSTEVVKITLQF